MMVRELGFEMKAQPSNRMKTEEELAREEQERLRRLEVLAGLGAFITLPSGTKDTLSQSTSPLDPSFILCDLCAWNFASPSTVTADALQQFLPM